MINRIRLTDQLDSLGWQLIGHRENPFYIRRAEQIVKPLGLASLDQERTLLPILGKEISGEVRSDEITEIHFRHDGRFQAVGPLKS
jgi:hypothetical protein